MMLSTHAVKSPSGLIHAVNSPPIKGTMTLCGHFLSPKWKDLRTRFENLRSPLTQARCTRCVQGLRTYR